MRKLKYQIGIRADASPKIGMGHIMRCMAIAEGLQEKDINVLFISANNYSEKVLKKNGYRVIVLGTPLEQMESEHAKLKELIATQKIDAFLVDSYYASDICLKYLQSYVPVIFIDGLYRCKAEVSAVINYNAAADINEYNQRFQEKNTKFMIGTQYVPLRTEFRKTQVHKKINERVKNILITTGAADPYGVLPALLKYIIFNDYFESATIHVIIGGLVRNREEIEQFICTCPRIISHYEVSNMREMMQEADIAISAAGTTVYELLFMGVPSVIYSIAEVQNNVSALVPAIIWAGDIRDFTSPGKLSQNGVRHIINRTLELASSYDKRKKMSHLAAQQVDGNGVSRIADVIIKLL